MSGPLLDPADPAHARVADRLAAEPILWFGTVSADGRPHSVPVWFLFADPVVLVFSRPDTAKIGRLAQRPGVALSLDTAAGGTDVVIAEGTARPGTGEPADELVSAFAGKYAATLGEGFAKWRETFSRPVPVDLDRIVAWWQGPCGLDRVAVR
ncbi:pyridoxamine 5'-phosphate oxidase family protein [Pseudonocardia nantongensis]|uniref:pyridoxamine 5'-phosphate oxidase family protein n=1 Tax=Pseudonocardia nantongensis TaxID=1181885 RepID=UPI00397897E6